MKFLGIRKRSWKKILMVGLSVLLVVGAVSGCVALFGNTKKEISPMKFSRGDIDQNGQFDNEIVNQRFDQLSKNSSLSGRLVYTEPLAKTLFLEASYQYSWNVSKSSKDTYNSGSNRTDDNGMLIFDPQGQAPDERYSNNSLKRTLNQLPQLRTITFLDIKKPISQNGWWVFFIFIID